VSTFRTITEHDWAGLRPRARARASVRRAERYARVICPVCGQVGRATVEPGGITTTHPAGIACWQPGRVALLPPPPRS
jgi:hypothetical protein